MERSGIRVATANPGFHRCAGPSGLRKLNHYQRPTDALGRNIQPSPTADLDTIAAMLAGR
ncbi:MAG TPA: hypothetical protein VF217_11645 [Rhodanobacteraceae bacterium]